VRRLLRVPLILAGAALLGAAPAFGSTGASIDVGSIAISEQLTPGSEYRLPTFGISNPGTETTSYELVVSHMAGQEAFQAPADWFEFSPASLSLEAGESRPVTTRLRIPPGAEPGAYLALVGPSIMNAGEGPQVGAGAAARVTFTIRPATWLEGFLRWLWQVLVDNPWIWIGTLLLVVLLVVWLLRRRFTISVARRS